MIEFVIICVWFGFLYALKGGSGKTIFPWWAKLRATNAITERLLDGKVISTIGALLFALIASVDTVSIDGGAYGVPEYAVNFLPAIVFAAAWLAAVAPSMGEEHGAIGTTRHGWGEYVDYSQAFGRSYGIKKGLQRGVWMGACMALATGFTPYIAFSLLFVPAVFIGQEIYYRITGNDSWVLSEPLIGLTVFGIPTALWIAAI